MHDLSQDNSEPRAKATALIPMLPASRSLPTQRRPVVAADSQDGITPGRILDAVRYWWKWALPAGIGLGIVASSVVYAMFAPQYQASAWLRIEEHAPYLAFEAKNPADRSKGFVATQIEMLRSPMVIRPVIAEREVVAIPEIARQDRPIDWMRESIVVKPVGESELYTVSFSCSQPQAAARVVNAIVDSYFQLRTAELGQRVETVVKLLELERDSRAQEVETRRKEVRELAKQVTGRDPFQSTPDPAPAATKPLADLANRLISAEVEETVLRAKLAVLENTDAKQNVLVPDSVIEKTVVVNPEVMKAAEMLAEERSRLSLLEAQLTRGTADPKHKRAAEKLAQDEKAFEQLKQTLRTEAKLHFEAQTSGTQKESLLSLRSDLENQRVAKDLLKERYEAELKTVKQSTGDSVSLRFKQDELTRAEKVLEMIAERAVMLRTERGAPPRVWEMQRAQVPTAPVQSLPYRNLLLAMVAGLSAPFGLAVVKEQFTRRISSVNMVEGHSHLAVIGEITRLPTRHPGAKSLGRQEERALHVFQESVESLRTSLLLGEHAGPLRMLTVASAVTKEGKTSVAVQLAVSIARASGGRVLVIDGDLRDPGIHTVFRLPREPGLTNVLAEAYSIRKAITPTWAEGVDALPAGLLLKRNPHKLLENGRWEALLKEIPSEYRYVIIDTPPVLAASESLVLARGADAVIMCAMRDVTRLPQLKKAAERMASAGGKIAGLVLNGIPTSHYANRYGNYYPYLLD